MRFKVEVRRTSYAFHTQEVTADSPQEANRIARERAGDYEYKETDAEYDVAEISIIKEGLAYGRLWFGSSEYGHEVKVVARGHDDLGPFLIVSTVSGGAKELVYRTQVTCVQAEQFDQYNKDTQFPWWGPIATSNEAERA